jgi:hypothetical protein
MKRDKYMGLDVHQATTVVSVIDAEGKIVWETIIATETGGIRRLIESISGPIHVTLEETTQAEWLYDLLQGFVAEVVVCDPRRNKLLVGSPNSTGAGCLDTIVFGLPPDGEVFLLTSPSIDRFLGVGSIRTCRVVGQVNSDRPGRVSNLRFRGYASKGAPSRAVVQDFAPFRVTFYHRPSMDNLRSNICVFGFRNWRRCRCRICARRCGNCGRRRDLQLRR